MHDLFMGQTHKRHKPHNMEQKTDIRIVRLSSYCQRLIEMNGELLYLLHICNVLAIES